MAQVPMERITNWHKAGLLSEIRNNQFSVSIESFGGKAISGFLNDTAISKAIDYLKIKHGGTVLFESGTYSFANTIYLDDSITLKGKGTNTLLQFNLNHSINNCINALGSVEKTKTPFNNASIGQQKLQYSGPYKSMNNGYIQLFQNDSFLAFSNWAYGSVGQIFKIDANDSNGKTLLMHTPLRLNFTEGVFTYFKTIHPIQNVSIECLKIIRLDSTINQTNNIYFNYAANCMIKGVESENTNFGHIVFDNSIHNEVTQSYCHHAFAYGGNGQGYGIVLQATSSDNKIENNICHNLRHSFLLQSGSNGNVVSYNYSKDAYWSDNILKDAAGDLVCHGNYTHHNLFEGNICQTIVIDNSHGKNGPCNTFFRNKAELYGVLISSNQDSQNLIANEITNTNAIMGQFVTPGKGHYSYNNNVKGQLLSNIILNNIDTSLYLKQKPGFISNNSNWPLMGYPVPINKGIIPSKIRYTDSGGRILCNTFNTHSSIRNLLSEKKSLIYYGPNPFNDFIKLNAIKYFSCKIYDDKGQLVFEDEGNSPLEILTVSWSEGLYTLVINNSEIRKLLKLNAN